MQIFNEVMQLLQKGVSGVSIILIVLGLIDIGTNWGENGSSAGVTAGFKKVIGGAIVGAAAAFLSQIRF
ncbi:hypothetical protein [Streptococcus sp. E17BB]|uniref:hypothetical protein n=1 Tax=Streptococcus sp. E17BB TaxID=3278714 RepID=UPI00359E0326